jgi:hypothetical protein
MGSTGSILQQDISDDLKFLIAHCDRQKKAISEYDGDALNKEVMKIFKKHSTIISIITSRTKSQLKNLYNNTKSNANDIEQLIGNASYAKFLRKLFLDKEVIEVELLVKSNKTMYDEEIVVKVLGSSTMDEIHKFLKMYQSKTCQKLEDKVDLGKNLSLTQKLILQIIKSKRNEHVKADLELAKQQAISIYKEASKFFGCNENVYFDILVHSSRSQCVAINDAYMSMYKVKLDRAIKSKMHGNAGKLLLLWILPIHLSVVALLHSHVTGHLFVDQMAIASVVAKYNKDVIADMDEACRKLYSEKLFSMIGGSLSGQLHRAVKGWIENVTPDSGYERTIEMYVENKKVENDVEFEDIIQNKEMVVDLQNFFENQTNELKAFIMLNNIPFDPTKTTAFLHNQLHDNKSTSRHSNSVNMSVNNNKKKSFIAQQKLSNKNNNNNNNNDNEDSENDEDGDDKFDEKNVEKKDVKKHAQQLMKLNKDSVRDLTKNETPEMKKNYNKKIQTVYNYLMQHFKMHHEDDYDAENADKEDEENSAVPSEFFWQVLLELPLNELGYTIDEVKSMQEWVEWETDGVVNYSEVLLEFADCVVSAIENKEKNDDVYSVIAELVLLQQEEVKKIKKRKSIRKSRKNLLHTQDHANNDRNKLIDSNNSKKDVHQPTVENNSSKSQINNNSINNTHHLKDVVANNINSEKHKIDPEQHEKKMEVEVVDAFKQQQQQPRSNTRLPKYFLQMLFDTFDAFDEDNNGYLNNDDLQKLLNVINLDLTVKDFNGSIEVFSFIIIIIIIFLLLTLVYFRSCKISL